MSEDGRQPEPTRLDIQAEVHAVALQLARIEGKVDALGTTTARNQEIAAQAHDRVTALAASEAKIKERVALIENRLITWPDLGKALAGFATICAIVGGGIWAIVATLVNALRG